MQDPNVPGKQRMSGGTIINELAFGEKPHSFDTKRPNVNFKDFKKTILQDIAFCVGIPPEVFMLQFENSFSASRQATIEFRSVVLKERNYFAKQFNHDIYKQWLLGMVMEQKITADGYVQAFKIGDVFGVEGWVKSRFVGFIKQNVDILKEAKAYKEYMDEGLMDRDQASSELTGSNFQTNVKRLKKQNKLLAEARDPLLGEINTSISRVEKEEVKEPKEKDEPAKRKERTPRKTAARISGFDRETTMALLDVLEDRDQMKSLLLEELSSAVDADVDEMDLEEESEE